MSTTERTPRPGAAFIAEADVRDNWFERLRTLVGLGAHPTKREDIAEALEDDDLDDLSVTAQERVLLRNVLALKGTRVDDVMVHRADIVAVSEDVTLGQLLTTFADGGHSRLPVHQGSLDEPKGMVHVKDALALFAMGAQGAHAFDPASVDLGARLGDTELVRPVIFAPPSMPATDLLARMQTMHQHLALVVDEYGGVDGLVTIEDLVETIVGDIEDEHDDEAVKSICEDGAGGFVADARAPLAEVAEAVGPGFDVSDYEDEVDTIGGLVVTLAGRVPAPGDEIEGPGGHLLVVRAADPRRVIEVGIAAPAEREPRESDRSGDVADVA